MGREVKDKTKQCNANTGLDPTQIFVEAKLGFLPVSFIRTGALTERPSDIGKLLLHLLKVNSVFKGLDVLHK